MVSNDLFNRHTGLAIVCPITITDRGFPSHLPVPGSASLTGFVMFEQVKSVDHQRRAHGSWSGRRRGSWTVCVQPPFWTNPPGWDRDPDREPHDRPANKFAGSPTAKPTEVGWIADGSGSLPGSLPVTGFGDLLLRPSYPLTDGRNTGPGAGQPALAGFANGEPANSFAGRTHMWCQTA